jgi:hypothetical protein
LSAGLWQLIKAGRVRVWQARKVAQTTRHLSLAAAKHVDAVVAQAILGLPWGRDRSTEPARPPCEDHLGEGHNRCEGRDLGEDQLSRDGDCGALIVRPSGVDVRRLRPKVVLHVHLSEEGLLAYHPDHGGGPCAGVARLENVGPITLGQLHRFLAGTGCDVTVQPVIDPATTAPVDGYEVPRRIRESMFLRQPASCFPYSARISRRVEYDHTIPYLAPDRGGPPG